MGEARRLGFLVTRDGPDAACAWARATMRTYRRVLLARGDRRALTLYRRPLIESYLALKRFVTGCGRGAPVQDLLERIEAYEARLRLARP